MKDTFDYKKNLCYEYDNLKFDGLTPREYVEFHQKNPGEKCRDLPENGCGECCQPIDRERGTNHCENICRNGNGEFARASAGVVIPIRAPTGFNRLNICQNNTCVDGGRLATFGGAPESSNDYEWLRPSLIDDKYYRLVEADVTDVVAKQGWKLSEPFVVTMMNDTWGKLPDPVFIEKRLGKDNIKIHTINIKG